MDLSLLGNNLKSIRVQRGYSQEKAAELCGVSEKTIGMIERAQANVTVGILSQIETGYRVSLKDLLRDDQEARRSFRTALNTLLSWSPAGNRTGSPMGSWPARQM